MEHGNIRLKIQNKLRHPDGLVEKSTISLAKKKATIGSDSY